jgi:hypothetical protein
MNKQVKGGTSGTADERSGENSPGIFMDKQLTRRKAILGGGALAAVATAGIIGRSLFPKNGAHDALPSASPKIMQKTEPRAIRDTNVSPLASASGSTQFGNQVVQWNKTLLVIVRTAGAQPATIHSTRDFAILHAAIYDAVNAIDGTHMPYLIQPNGGMLQGPASQDAAAASAAHEVLVSLYPSFKTMLDAQLQQSLAQIPDGCDKTTGVSLGQSVADSLLALRSNDGSATVPTPYVFGTGPGDYQSTPPNFPKQPQYLQWPEVTTFALEDANQFRPGPPPSLTSAAYTDAFNEIKALGIVNSTVASPDQVQIGRFWGGQIQDFWNEIAQTAALEHNLTTAQSARLFALLNLSLADSTIAFYDAKYTYNFWRPVTAIRDAGIANNPSTVADPNWLPLAGNTAPDPSYPGAHATISAAAAIVLISFFYHDKFAFNLTSEVLPGVVRTFQSFSDAATEASLSRIYAGQHFRTDESAGQNLGRHVAQFVFDNLLLPLEREYESTISTISVTTTNSGGSPLAAYAVSLSKDGVELQTHYSACSFVVENGETYQISVADSGSETFSGWSDGLMSRSRDVTVPDTSTTIDLTAIYSP